MPIRPPRDFMSLDSLLLRYVLLHAAWSKLTCAARKRSHHLPPAMMDCSFAACGRPLQPPTPPDSGIERGLLNPGHSLPPNSVFGKVVIQRHCTMCRCVDLQQHRSMAQVGRADSRLSAKNRSSRSSTSSSAGCACPEPCLLNSGLDLPRKPLTN
jgi:hypothetical protein